MKPEEKNKEVDINEVAITLEVDSEVISKVHTGEITHILMDISEDNQSLVLENIVNLPKSVALYKLFS